TQSFAKIYSLLAPDLSNAKIVCCENKQTFNIFAFSCQGRTELFSNLSRRGKFSCQNQADRTKDRRPIAQSRWDNGRDRQLVPDAACGKFVDLVLYQVPCTDDASGYHYRLRAQADYQIRDPDA